MRLAPLEGRLEVAAGRRHGLLVASLHEASAGSSPRVISNPLGRPKPLVTDSKALGMFDNVVVRDTPETAEAGVAGLVGQVYGVTTPSSTGIEFIGDQTVDCALNVPIESLDKDVGLSPALVEFVDHAPGNSVQVGPGPEMIRQPDGTWRASPSPRARRAWWWPGLALLVVVGLFCLYLAAYRPRST